MQGQCRIINIENKPAMLVFTFKFRINMLFIHTLSQLRTSVNINYGSEPQASKPQRKKDPSRLKHIKNWTVNAQPYPMYHNKHKCVSDLPIWRGNLVNDKHMTVPFIHDCNQKFPSKSVTKRKT